jgi:hypothetical protein
VTFAASMPTQIFIAQPPFPLAPACLVPPASPYKAIGGIA